MPGIESAATLVSRRYEDDVCSDEGGTQSPTTDGNAERTSSMPPTALYSSAGTTSNGDYFASAGVLKSHQSRGNVDVEVFSVSAQGGCEFELQAAMAHVSLGSEKNGFRAGVDAFTADIHSGIHNADGSTGYNLGMGATIAGVSAEARLGNHASVSGAVALGPGGQLSIGVKDEDHDGQREYCAKLGGGLLARFTLGICVENPF